MSRIIVKRRCSWWECLFFLMIFVVHSRAEQPVFFFYLPNGSVWDDVNATSLPEIAPSEHGKVVMKLYLMEKIKKKDIDDMEKSISGHTVDPQKKNKDILDICQDAVKMGQDERKALLQFHNRFRSSVNPKAANMRYITWDEALEKKACEFATNHSSQFQKECAEKHNQTAAITSNPSLRNSLESQCMNVFIGGETREWEVVLKAWFQQGKQYDLDRNLCKSGTCQSYIKMVRANHDLVGCYHAPCAQAFVTICAYGCSPKVKREIYGVEAKEPYIKGIPCSACEGADGGYCFDKLLCISRELCSKFSHIEEKCGCGLKCFSCGTLLKEECRCKCRVGWDGLDCSQSCLNEHNLCGEHPDWNTTAGCKSNSIKYKLCRRMCGMCQDIVGANHKQMANACCGGITCPSGKALVEGNCACESILPTDTEEVRMHAPRRRLKAHGTPSTDGSRSESIADLLSVFIQIWCCHGLVWYITAAHYSL